MALMSSSALYTPCVSSSALALALSTDPPLAKLNYTARIPDQNSAVNSSPMQVWNSFQAS